MKRKTATRKVNHMQARRFIAAALSASGGQLTTEQLCARASVLADAAYNAETWIEHTTIRRACLHMCDAGILERSSKSTHKVAVWGLKRRCA